jgi:hypothetical protein
MVSANINNKWKVQVNKQTDGIRQQVILIQCILHTINQGNRIQNYFSLN